MYIDETTFHVLTKIYIVCSIGGITRNYLTIFQDNWLVHTIAEMAKDAALPDFSGKFQICPVNPSSLSDNLSDNLKKKPM